jgi:predicted DCC family thiol-disulfide oxidoreductase YuxK
MLKSPSNTESSNLPSPTGLPSAEVVIYDGECQFCTRQVARLARWDGRGRLAFLSLHDPVVSERYPDLSHERLMEEMVLITRDGRRLGGAAAFRCLTRRLPRLWLLAPLMHIPFSLPLWQWAYRQVAKRRHRWNKAHGKECTNDSCSVHFK